MLLNLPYNIARSYCIFARVPGLHRLQTALWPILGACQRLVRTLQLTMWYSRKFAPLFPISVLIGGTVSLWKKAAIEAYTASLAPRILIYLLPAFLSFIVILSINIALICRFGRNELKERLKAQWAERFLARVENRNLDYRFDDIVDYVALVAIWYSKTTYALRLWDWPGQ